MTQTVLAVGVLALVSCTAQRVAQEATPGAVEGAVGALEERETQARLADIAAEPEVRRAAENVAATATDGIIAALSEEERQAELTDLTGRYISAVSTAFAQNLGRDLSPEVQRMVAGSVDASIREISSERNIARVEQLTAGLTDSVLRGVLSGVHRGAGPEVVSALMRDTLKPGLIALLDEDMNRALGVTAYEMSRQAVLGAEEGIAGRQSRGGVLQRWLLEGPGAIIAALLLLALLGGLVFLALRARRLRRENERREAALLSLAQALKATEGLPWAPELRQSLRDQLRDQAGADYLREVLRTHQDLRMRPHH